MRSLLTVLIILFPTAIHALDTSHFVNYYRFYNPALTFADDQCSNTRRDFEANPTPQTCKSHTNCLIGEVAEINKADMASAAVLLGLTPIMLSMIGPNLAEISMLSSRRPMLSFLLAMNTPALNIGSFFEFRYPVQALKEQDYNHALKSDIRSRINGPVVGLQYALLLASIANVVTNSIQLGAWTVVSWKCMATYMPALWTCLSFVAWVFALISFKFQLVGQHNKDDDSNSTCTERDTLPQQDRRWWQNEFMSCNDNVKVKDSILVTALKLAFNTLAWLTVYISLWFGTLTLSSLLFIGTLDAFTVIIRYFASAIVSRFITSYEFGGISL
jgi:hypothetical protein